MGFVVPEPSAALRRAALSVAPGRSADETLESASDAAPSADLAAAHPVFELRLADIGSGAGLEAAERVASRSLVMRDAVVLGAVALPDHGISHPEREAVLEHGALAESLGRLISELEATDLLAEHEFELRLLRVPALGVQAAWLVSASGSHDRIVPLAAVGEARAGDVMLVGPFIVELERIASRLGEPVTQPGEPP